MAKQEAEWSNRLSVFWLKKHGYFPKEGGWRSGGIKWTYGLSENESSIGFTVVTPSVQDTTNFTKNELEEFEGFGTEKETYIKLKYTHTNRWTGEKAELDYKVLLTTTPCNYGGIRYWFICSLSKNGRYCGRRVGVVYSIDKWFGCRRCGEIAYAAQMKGGRFRGSSVCAPDIDKLEQEIKRWYYRGKPTRKHKRLMRMNEKLERDFIRVAGVLDPEFAQKWK